MGSLTRNDVAGPEPAGSAKRRGKKSLQGLLKIPRSQSAEPQHPSETYQNRP
jgi:hypothetical protein